MPQPILHIAHLVNAVMHPADPALLNAQQITFESMRVAAAQAGPGITVELLTAQFAEDHPVIPAYFRKTHDLDRSADDFASFTHPRKLPLLHDLLQRLYDESEAEYLVYTNVDIALQPHFYAEVARRIRFGFDAFIINRRRLPPIFSTTEELFLMYSLPGSPHPGFDCFIFHRSLFPKFRLAAVCIGIPFVEITFSQNFFCYASNFRLFTKAHLTFHIGMEVFKKRDAEYLRYNRTEYRKAIGQIWHDLDNRKFPWGHRNIFYRMIRWAVHPAIPIRLALALEWRRWRSK